MDEWMDGEINGQKDVWICGAINKFMNKLMDKQIYDLVDRLIDGWMNWWGN